MRCTYCGAPIPDDMVYCPECGREVQIVPDYNPLEDVLVQEVKGSVQDATRQIRTGDIRKYRRDEAREYSNSTRVLSQGELERIRTRRNASGQRSRYEEAGVRRAKTTTGSMGKDRRAASPLHQTGRVTGAMRHTGATGALRQGTGAVGLQEEERRRRQARKKRLAKKRRQRTFIVILVLLILLGGLGFILYQGSYAGQVKKGNRALKTGQYTLAENYFNRAISKNHKRGDAYTGLSDVYLKQNDQDGAEAVFLTAISSQPSNAELYKAAIQFYVKTNQLVKISQLLDGSQDDAVLLAVKPYVSDQPQFSLKEGTYPEVQQVTLKSGKGTIYYTTDGSEPDTSSTKYKEPILLKEGQTTIKAISVNKKDVPSLTVSKVYNIDIPVADAPAVTPSTGQYDTPMQITINVPEGYTAYYTTDGTDPTAASNKYTGPISMPQGQTLFSAILVNKSGKSTQITKRNYVLETAQ